MRQQSRCNFRRALTRLENIQRKIAKNSANNIDIARGAQTMIFFFIHNF